MGGEGERTFSDPKHQLRASTMLSPTSDYLCSQCLYLPLEGPLQRGGAGPSWSPKDPQCLAHSWLSITMFHDVAYRPHLLSTHPGRPAFGPPWHLHPKFTDRVIARKQLEPQQFFFLLNTLTIKNLLLFSLPHGIIVLRTGKRRDIVENA